MAERKGFHAETAIFVAHEEYTKRDAAESEKNLMRAVLQAAMEDIKKKGEVYRDARRYFGSRDDFYLYSFMSVCYHLNLCPRTIRTLVGLAEEASRNEQAPENLPDSRSEEDEKVAA